MPLSWTATARKLFTFGELITSPLLNLATFLTGTISGQASTSQIEDAAVTSAKTKVGPHFFCANNGSAVNDYRVTTNAALTDGTVADGTIITFEVASATNTGASTFKADTMTARSLVKQFNVALAAGDLRLGQMVSVMWDASTTTWQMLSVAGNPDIRHASAISADGLAYSAPTSPTLTALTNGARVVVKWATANTGAVTLNLDSLGAKDVRKLNDQPLVAGDLLADQFSLLVYDTTLTHWLMLSPVTINTPATVVGLSRGLVIKSNAADPTFKVDITADDVVLKNSGGLSYLAEAVSLTANMSASGANGLDTGAEAPSTWYYLWAIYNGTTVAALISTSTTSPTLPTGYTYKALLGAIYNDSGSNLRNVLQYGRDVWIDDTVVFTAKTGVTSYTALSGADLTAMQTCVPPMARSVRGTMGNLSSGGLGMAVAADANGLGAQAMISQNGTATDTFTTGAPFSGVPFKTAQTLYYKMTDTTASVYRLKVSGYTL